VRRVFVDTFFWVALADRRDAHHQQARALRQRLRSAQLFTTDEVLVEFVTTFSAYGAVMRTAAVQTVHNLHTTPNIVVVPQTREPFMVGLALYAVRPDKEYSLTDCISMETMRQLGLTEVLTRDHHFAQEGFTLVPASPQAGRRRARGS
jgi:predicted nucleic acid-binding protein